MSILTRTVLAWLLMLAIPLQGIAATAMLFCAPGHHGMATAGAEPVAHTRSHPASASATEHVGHAGHHHDAAQAALSSQPDASAHQHNQSSKAADAKCSACAACCIGSAIVSTHALSPVAVTGSVLIPFTLASFASHIPLGADPPPRAIFA